VETASISYPGSPSARRDGAQFADFDMSREAPVSGGRHSPGQFQMLSVSKTSKTASPTSTTSTLPRAKRCPCTRSSGGRARRLNPELVGADSGRRQGGPSRGSVLASEGGCWSRRLRSGAAQHAGPAKSSAATQRSPSKSLDPQWDCPLMLEVGLNHCRNGSDAPAEDAPRL
jgi:hypothetical protein